MLFCYPVLLRDFDEVEEGIDEAAFLKEPLERSGIRQELNANNSFFIGPLRSQGGILAPQAGWGLYGLYAATA